MLSTLVLSNENQACQMRRETPASIGGGGCHNIMNLEDVMVRAGIMVKRITDSEKGTYYNKIFPINTEPISVDTLNQIRSFANKIKPVRQTNMLKFIEYCFEQIPNEELWVK